MAASTYDSTTTEGYRITCEEVRGGIERTEYRGIEGFKCLGVGIRCRVWPTQSVEVDR